MMHRTYFLANPSEQNYHEYYFEIVFASKIKVSTFSFRHAVICYRKKDFNLNRLHKHIWVEMLNDVMINKFVENVLKAHGDKLTKSNAGCILKEAIYIRMKIEYPELVEDYNICEDENETNE